MFETWAIRNWNGKNPMLVMVARTEYILRLLVWTQLDGVPGYGFWLS